MKKNQLTIEDKIKKEFSFELKPDTLRINMSQKNYLFVCYYHNLLKNFWIKNSNKKQMDLIFFNKVFSELIRLNKKKLDFITRGWYLYGIAIAQPSSNQFCVPSKSELIKGTGFKKQEIERFDKQIEKIAFDYDPDKNHFYWEEKQYENENNDIYKAKLSLQKSLSKKDVLAIDEALSRFSFALLNSNVDFALGLDLLKEFVRIAKQIIISNNNSIPDKGEFKKAFKNSWECYARINLFITARGIDAEKVKINSGKNIELFADKANKSLVNLTKQIKDNNLDIIANDIQKDYLENINAL